MPWAQAEPELAIKYFHLLGLARAGPKAAEIRPAGLYRPRLLFPTLPLGWGPGGRFINQNPRLNTFKLFEETSKSFYAHIKIVVKTISFFLPCTPY